MTQPVSPLLGLGIAMSSALAGYEEGRQKARKENLQDKQEQRTQERFNWQRDAAAQRKMKGEARLQQLQMQNRMQENLYDVRENSMEQQLQAQAQQSNQLENKLLKQETMTALDNYFASGDARSLNRFFQDNKDNPKVQRAFRGTVRMEELNFDSPSDKALLKQAGMTDEQLDELVGKKDGVIDKEKLKRRFVKSIKNDGSVKLTDMLKEAAALGYQKYAERQNLERMKSLADLRAHQQQRQPLPTATARDSALYAELKDKAEKGTATEQELNRLRWLEQEQGGTEVAKTTIATEADIQLQDKLDMPWEEYRKDPEVRRLVRQLEMEYDLSTQDKKELTDLATLSSVLGGTQGAVNLSTAQTGLIDKWVGGFESKVFEGQDTRTKNAYGAFINEFRHNLFGSALTDKEIKAFNEAYQSRSDKLGPVLSGLRAAARQLEGRFEAIANQNEEAVMKYRSGLLGEDLQNAVANIDHKINLLGQYANGELSDQELKEGFNAEPQRQAEPRAPKAAEPVDLKQKYGW